MREPTRPGTPVAIRQHSLKLSLLLHLLPGAVATIAYLILAPIGERLGLPSFLMLLVAAVFFALSFELGCLLREGRKRSSSFSLTGVVMYREPMPAWQYVVLSLLLLLWLAFVAAVINPPVESAIVDSLFSWVPSIYFFDSFADHIADYSRSTLIVSALLLVVINGVVGPIIEEMYFRGYLLPRISKLRGWAPLLNSVLFSLYHFFTPWQNPLRILAFTPVFCTVWWKKNIYIGIIVHCLGNLLGSIAVLVVIMRS
jgi:membrane protease YdiL (CAAX protease family)